MGKKMNRMIGNYQLREAGGYCWLIDMTQTGKDWKRPLCLNESGARILQGLAEKRSMEEIAAELAGDYDLPMQRIREDMDAFLAQLCTSGITFT